MRAAHNTRRLSSHEPLRSSMRPERYSTSGKSSTCGRMSQTSAATSRGPSSSIAARSLGLRTPASASVAASRGSEIAPQRNRTGPGSVEPVTTVNSLSTTGSYQMHVEGNTSENARTIAR